MKIWYNVNGWGVAYTGKQRVHYAHIKCNASLQVNSEWECLKCKEWLKYDDAWRLSLLWGWCTPPDPFETPYDTDSL